MTGISLITRGYINPFRLMVQQAQSSPVEAQALLVKSLETPLPDSIKSPTGIVQSHIIVRSAIIAGLANLRANPWLLDHVFGFMPKDPNTFKEYGEASLDQAKNWFLKTDIPVIMAPNLNEGRWPCITVHLADSVEDMVTLGDVHVEPYVDVENVWPDLTTKFTPSNYSPATGIMSASETFSIVIAPGMILIDALGREYPILDTFADGSWQITPGTVADFTNSVIRSAKPSHSLALESVSYRDTFQIGVHVNNHPTYLVWLHTLVMFTLLRDKEALLEGRGFERSTASSSDFMRNPEFVPENVYSRYISLVGYVRHVWPKGLAPKIQQITGIDMDKKHNLVVVDEGKAPDPEKRFWITSAEEDDE